MLTLKKEDADNYVILYPFLLNIIKHYAMFLYINIGFDDGDNIPMIEFTIIYSNIP